MHRETTNIPEPISNDPYRTQLKPAEPLQTDRDLPEKLVRAMRRAEPLERWDSTEDHLKRGFNRRLARSEEAAAEWALRETKAYNDYANDRQKRRIWAAIARAATALLAVATYIVSKTWGN